MKILSLIIVLIFIECSYAACNLEQQLSCSRNGTKLFFINGVFGFESISKMKTLLFGDEEDQRTNRLFYRASLNAASKMEALFMEAIGDDNKSQIDEKKIVFSEALYNWGDPLYVGDLFEFGAQKLMEGGMSESAAIGVMMTMMQKGESYLLKSSLASIPAVSTLAFPLVHGTVNAITIMHAKSISSHYKSDVSRFVASVRSSLESGNKAILISHSQGNMFANQIVEHILSNDEDRLKYSSSLRNLQVATPAKSVVAETCELRSYYTLTQDLVINYLARAASFGNVLPANIRLDSMEGFLGSDLTIHGFKETYFTDKIVTSVGSDNLATRPKSSLKDVLQDELVSLAKSMPSNCGCTYPDGSLEESYVWPNGGGFVSINSQVDDTEIEGMRTVYIDPNSMVCGNSQVKGYVYLNGGSIINNSNVEGTLEKPVSLDSTSRIDSHPFTNEPANVIGPVQMIESTIRGGSYIRTDLYNGALAEGDIVINPPEGGRFYLVEKAVVDGKWEGINISSNGGVSDATLKGGVQINSSTSSDITTIGKGVIIDGNVEIANSTIQTASSLKVVSSPQAFRPVSIVDSSLNTPGTIAYGPQLINTRLDSLKFYTSDDNETYIAGKVSIRDSLLKYGGHITADQSLNTGVLISGMQGEISKNYYYPAGYTIAGDVVINNSTITEQVILSGYARESTISNSHLFDYAHVSDSSLTSSYVGGRYGIYSSALSSANLDKTSLADIESTFRNAYLSNVYFSTSQSLNCSGCSIKESNVYMYSTSSMYLPSMEWKMCEDRTGEFTCTNKDKPGVSL